MSCSMLSDDSKTEFKEDKYDDDFVECPTDCTVCSFKSEGEMKCLTCKDKFTLSSTSDSCLNK